MDDDDNNNEMQVKVSNVIKGAIHIFCESLRRMESIGHITEISTPPKWVKSLKRLSCFLEGIC
jgi:hypothetical protein